MDTISLESLSEDEEYTSYLNAVTQLKALKKKNCTIRESQDDPKDIVVNTSNIPVNSETVQPLEQLTHTENQFERAMRPVTRSRRRLRERRTTAPNSNCRTTHDLNCSMEIVSLEEDDRRTNTKSQPIIYIDGDDKKVATEVLISDDEEPNEDENYIVDVKVLWRSKTVVRLNIRRYESFQKVFQYFAAMESVPEEQILILRNELPINRTDTPVSIGLSVIDILEGGVINPETIASQSGCQTNQNEVLDTNLCKIKVQTANKQSLIVTLKKDQRFKAVILSCAEQLNIEESKIKLYFDGEQISKTDTPESLDLEQEACVDLKVVTS